MSIFIYVRRVIVTEFLTLDVFVEESPKDKDVTTMEDIIQLILLILFVVEIKKLIDDNDKHNDK